ncbi:hypothetical protein, partial [Pseudomonas aeruginosa]
IKSLWLLAIHSSGFSLFVMTEFYTCSGNDVNAATSRRCRKTFVLRQAVSRRCATCATPPQKCTENSIAIHYYAETCF